MKRILGGFVLLLAAAAAFVLLFSGCDTPNDPNLPTATYHLVRAHNFAGAAEDVVARGNYVAVAKGSQGAEVFRNTGTDSLAHVFSYVNAPDAYCRKVALNIEYSLLAVFTSPADVYNRQVFDFRIPDQDSAGLEVGPIGGPLWNLDLWARQDSFIMWFTDYTSSDRNLVPNGYERTTDSTLWSTFIKCPEIKPATQPRGFVIRETDGAVFVAVEDLGVMIYDQSNCAVTDTIQTPGVAYDCALAGNTLVIADEYSIQVARLTDPVHGEIVSSLDVGASSSARAHRLRHVTIDGPFAIVSDDIDGIYVIDISTPSAPRFVQLLGMHDVNKVSADGHGNLYVACTEQGFLHYKR